MHDAETEFPRMSLSGNSPLCQKGRVSEQIGILLLAGHRTSILRLPLLSSFQIAMLQRYEDRQQKREVRLQSIIARNVVLAISTMFVLGLLVVMVVTTATAPAEAQDQYSTQYQNQYQAPYQYQTPYQYQSQAASALATANSPCYSSNCSFNIQGRL